MPFASARVLVVDGDEALIQLTQLFINKFSRHRYVFETSPRAALALLRDHHFDVLVTDPACDLPAEARRIQPGIGVVTISSLRPPADAPRFGGDYFLKKPFYLPELTAVIERARPARTEAA